MSDLARLGMRIESEEVATADKRLDDFTASAERAERATDSLAGGSKRTASALMDMLAAIQKDIASMVELQRATAGVVTANGALAASEKQVEKAIADVAKATKNANDNVKLYSGSINDMNTHVKLYLEHQAKVTNGAKLQSHEMLNLSRQFSDLAVTGAMGMNPLMILIQQGPQIADIFAQAATRGVSLKAALAGIVADMTPLLATLGPLTLGFGAVAAVVWNLVDAHQKQDKAIKDLNAALQEQRDALSKLSPWIFLTGENSNLAADGQRNFDNWLKKTNVSLAEQNRLLRENTLNELNKKALDAADNLRKAQEQFDKVNKAGPVMMSAGAPGGFGIVAPVQATDPKNNPFYKEAAENLKIAKEAADAIGVYQAKMGQAPDIAFADPVKKTRAPSEKDKRLAAATADGRYATGAANDPGIRSIDVQTVEDYNKYAKSSVFTSKGGLNDVDPKKIDDQYKTAEDRAKAYADFEQHQRDARLAAEAKMWDGLIGLQYSSNKKIAAVGKAAAIYQATIDGIAAVQSAYKSLPFPFNLAAAGVMAALTAANVAQIAGVKGFKDGGWTGYGATDKISGVTHGQEFVVKAGPAAANRAMLEALNAGQAPAAPSQPSAPPTANGSGGQWNVVVSPNPLFDAHLERVSGNVARPIANQARRGAVSDAMGGVADEYARRNVRKLS